LAILRSESQTLLKREIMRADSIGYWKDKKEKLLKRYNILTEKDLRFDLGNERAMLQILADKLGKTDQELLTIIISI
jgi:hypothetical protein